MLSFIELCTLHQKNPYAYLRDVPTRRPSATAHDLDALLSDQWQPV